MAQALQQRRRTQAHQAALGLQGGAQAGCAVLHLHTGQADGFAGGLNQLGGRVCQLQALQLQA